MTSSTLRKPTSKEDPVGAGKRHCIDRLMERYDLTREQAIEKLELHEYMLGYGVGVEVIFKGSAVGSLVYCIRETEKGRAFYAVRKYDPVRKKFVLTTYLHPDHVIRTLMLIIEDKWVPWKNN